MVTFSLLKMKMTVEKRNSNFCPLHEGAEVKGEKYIKTGFQTELDRTPADSMPDRYLFSYDEKRDQKA